MIWDKLIKRQTLFKVVFVRFMSRNRQFGGFYRTAVYVLSKTNTFGNGATNALRMGSWWHSRSIQHLLVSLDIVPNTSILDWLHFSTLICLHYFKLKVAKVFGYTAPTGIPIYWWLYRTNRYTVNPWKDALRLFISKGPETWRLYTARVKYFQKGLLHQSLVCFPQVLYLKLILKLNVSV